MTYELVYTGLNLTATQRKTTKTSTKVRSKICLSCSRRKFCDRWGPPREWTERKTFFVPPVAFSWDREPNPFLRCAPQYGVERCKSTRRRRWLVSTYIHLGKRWPLYRDVITIIKQYRGQSIADVWAPLWFQTQMEMRREFVNLVLKLTLKPLVWESQISSPFLRRPHVLSSVRCLRGCLTTILRSCDR